MSPLRAWLTETWFRTIAPAHCQFCGGAFDTETAVHHWNGRKWECQAILEPR